MLMTMLGNEFEIKSKHYLEFCYLARILSLQDAKIRSLSPLVYCIFCDLPSDKEIGFRLKNK
jgi:hypothetical protein